MHIAQYISMIHNDIVNSLDNHIECKDTQDSFIYTI